jgi:hypothetical protein
MWFNNKNLGHPSQHFKSCSIKYKSLSHTLTTSHFTKSQMLIPPKNHGPRPRTLGLDSFHLRQTPSLHIDTEATNHRCRLPKVPSDSSWIPVMSDRHNLTNTASECHTGGESTRRSYGASPSTAGKKVSIKNPFENFTYITLLFF